MGAVAKAGKNTIIARIRWAHEPGQTKRIDLWWGGLQNNGDLMLLLAYLLRLNSEWADARLRVRTIARSQQERESQLEGLHRLIPETRIDAETEVILEPDLNRNVADIMHHYSRGSEVVILGLKEPAPGEEEQYAKRLTELAEGFNTTIFVRSAGEFAGQLI
jgi:hypothetical protein